MMWLGKWVAEDESITSLIETPRGVRRPKPEDKWDALDGSRQ